MHKVTTKLISVYFGGQWEKNEEGLAYIGDSLLKPFVINNETTLEELEKNVRKRFDVDYACEIEFSHLNPFKKTNESFKVQSTEDLQEFVEISTMDSVDWTLPLYTTMKRRIVVDKEGIGTAESVTAVIERSSVVEVVENFNCIEDVEDDEMDDESEDERNSNERYRGTKVYMIEQGERSEYICNEGDGQRHHQLMHVGKIFKSKEELKTAVTMMSIADTFGYKVKKSTPKYFRAGCVDKRCKWAIHCSCLMGTELFEVTKFNWKHTCSLQTRSSQRHQVSSKIVAEKIKARFEESSSAPNPRDIQAYMRTDHKIKVSYWKCWKAKELAEAIQNGSPEESYALLPAYCYMLTKLNPGTTTSIMKGGDDRFKYVFISFGASIRAFPVLRKVIIVDGTFLIGKYGGTLLIATTQDANDQLYPLAFAIVDSENNMSWTWFFQQLVKLIPLSDDLVFVSDRHKSIARAVGLVYPKVKHYLCIWHLNQNLRVRFKKKRLCRLFKSAAESYTMRGFQDYYDAICKSNPNMGVYLEDAGIERWARAFATRDRYNMMTSNTAESMNSVMRSAKGYPIVSVLNHMREQLSNWFCDRRMEALKDKPELPSKVMLVVNERCKEVGRYSVKALNDYQFEIIGEDLVMVDLFARRCTCRVFDLDKIPCVHAIAAIMHKRLKIESYVSSFYGNEAYYLAYKETIYPVLGRSDWNVPDEIKTEVCNPPIVRKKSGRPRKKRKLSVGEFRSKRRA